MEWRSEARDQVIEGVAHVIPDVMSSQMMMTFRLVAVKVVPRRGRAMSSMSKVYP